MPAESPDNGAAGEAAAPKEAPAAPAGGAGGPGERPRRPDRTTPAVRIAVVVAAAALIGYIVYDYVAKPVPAMPKQQPSQPEIPLRAVSEGGWLYGLKRVEVKDERPWVKVGIEVGRRKLAPPVSPKGMPLKDAYLYVALFTDGSYVPLRSLESGEVRAIVCAPADEKYALVRALFQRCSAGGSAVALVLVRVGRSPAAVPVTLGALPVVKLPVRVEVSREPGGIKVTANGYGCKDLDDLAAKLERLRQGRGEEKVFVRLSVADELPVSTFVEAALACGAPKEQVYVALTPLR